MDEALLALLEKKEFAYITIRELCAAAGVNRSTFYLHYQNMTELLEESIAYMNRQFYECFPPKHEDAAKAHFLSPAYLEPYRCIGKVELLPFHKMADFKWKALGLENRLADTPEPEAAALREAESLFPGRSRDCRQP